MYDVNFFIRKFEAIPEDKWITGKWELNGNHCALGHCGAIQSDVSLTDEACALNELLTNVIAINDGRDQVYAQPTPKQRILAALNDIRDTLLSEANLNYSREIANENLLTQIN